MVASAEVFHFVRQHVLKLSRCKRLMESPRQHNRRCAEAQRQRHRNIRFENLDAAEQGVDFRGLLADELGQYQTGKQSNQQPSGDHGIDRPGPLGGRNAPCRDIRYGVGGLPRIICFGARRLSAGQVLLRRRCTGPVVCRGQAGNVRKRASVRLHNALLSCRHQRRHDSLRRRACIRRYRGGRFCLTRLHFRVDR